MSGKKVVNWRRRTKQNALIYKGSKCIVCGYDRCPRAMHFHHIDPAQKDLRIGSGVPRAWITIRTELDKCALLCSNCHSEVHDGILDLALHLHKSPTPEEGIRSLAKIGVGERLAKSAKRGERQPAAKPTCQRCGASVTKRSTYCKPCHKKAVPPPTKIAWPSAEDLLREVEATSKWAVAARLGVSDVAVKKRLMRYLPGYKTRPYKRTA